MKSFLSATFTTSQNDDMYYFHYYLVLSIFISILISSFTYELFRSDLTYKKKERGLVLFNW